MVILDTNVISELTRPNPSLNVVDWITHQPTEGLYLTAVSEAELLYGVEILPPGQRRADLRAAIEGMLREDYAGRILPFHSFAVPAFVTIAADRRAAGRPIGFLDCQIAAIARSAGAAVATRNTKDFEDCGIRLINPWATT